jgi:hypothetical protein
MDFLIIHTFGAPNNIKLLYRRNHKYSNIVYLLLQARALNCCSAMFFFKKNPSVPSNLITMYQYRTEGSEKTIRGVEWESIKIPRRNSGYILKSTQHPSLLTRVRPHNYRKAIGPQNRIRNHENTAEDNNRYKSRHCETTTVKSELKESSSLHRHFT